MRETYLARDGVSAMSPTDFHVLLVLAGGELYGYAILKAVEQESGGAVRPEIGSLYRVLARLMAHGLVDEVTPADTNDAPAHRGRPRRYYALTREGRQALEGEAERISGALDIAKSRALLADGPQS